MNVLSTDKIWTGILYIVAFLVVRLLLFLFWLIISNGWRFWVPNILFGQPSNTQTGGGISPQLFNSLYILVLTLVISVPLGLGAGIYLAEFVKSECFLDFVRLCIEILASLPSIEV